MEFQIYSKDPCPYCAQAVFILKNANLPYKEFKLGEHFTREELLEQFPEAKTFPQIQVVSDNGTVLRYVGGFQQLKQFLEQDLHELRD